MFSDHVLPPVLLYRYNVYNFRVVVAGFFFSSRFYNIQSYCSFGIHTKLTNQEEVTVRPDAVSVELHFRKKYM